MKNLHWEALVSHISHMGVNDVLTLIDTNSASMYDMYYVLAHFYPHNAYPIMRKCEWEGKSVVWRRTILQKTMFDVNCALMCNGHRHKITQDYEGCIVIAYNWFRSDTWHDYVDDCHVVIQILGH